MNQASSSALLSRLLPLAALAAAALQGTACSLTLDFDRTYPARGIFPGEFIKPPNEGEKPIESGSMATSCGDFCEAYIGCLAQKDTCHYIWALPESSEAICRDPVPGRDDLITKCTNDCVDAGTLTKSQLKSVQNTGECIEVAEAVVSAEPDACTPLEKECKALCNPPAGQESLADCRMTPGLNKSTCERVCENQSALYFECVNCQPVEQTLCASVQTCAMYYSALGDSGSNGNGNGDSPGADD